MIETRKTSKTPGHSLRIYTLLALVTLLLSGCASSGPGRGSSTDAVLYGVVGDRLVRVDPESGEATQVETSRALHDIGALTWAPAESLLYAVSRSTQDPALIRIDPASGEVSTVGPIDLPDFDLVLVEGLAFDPESGLLFASAASPRTTNRHSRGGFSTFASDLLIAIDTETAEARSLATIRGTLQGELDALVIYGGDLFGVDVVAGSSEVFGVDPENGQTQPTGLRFDRAVKDLAFSPEGRLVASTDEGLTLLAMNWADGEVTELASLSGLDSGTSLRAVTCSCVPKRMDLLIDGFESGGLSRWRKSEGASRN